MKRSIVEDEKHIQTFLADIGVPQGTRIVLGEVEQAERWVAPENASFWGKLRQLVGLLANSPAGKVKFAQNNEELLTLLSYMRLRSSFRLLNLLQQNNEGGLLQYATESDTVNSRLFKSRVLLIWQLEVLESFFGPERRNEIKEILEDTHANVY